MASSPIFSFFLVFSSFLHLGYSVQSASDLIQSLTQQTVDDANGLASIECLEKLIPCQSFINSPTNVTATCCSPLKEVVANDIQCLCNYFNDPEMLKVVNITQEQTLELPKACNLTADVSICKKEASAPTPTPTVSDYANLPNVTISDIITKIPPAPSSATKTTSLGAASLIALVFAAC